jgi:hypothetical protein
VSPVPRSYVVSPAVAVAGEIRVPGDKSISHRAAMLGAIAEGTTEIHGFLESGDCIATLAALSAMGVRSERAVRAARPRQFRHLDAIADRHPRRPVFRFRARRRCVPHAATHGAGG